MNRRPIARPRAPPAVWLVRVDCFASPWLWCSPRLHRGYGAASIFADTAQRRGVLGLSLEGGPVLATRWRSVQLRCEHSPRFPSVGRDA